MASTTEITSSELASDNPVHQRLLKAYYAAPDYLSKESVLEIGCGVGRGISILHNHFNSYTAIDKNEKLLAQLSQKFPDVKFYPAIAPDLSRFEDNAFDSIISFQVIEHIQEDVRFLEEINRVLKPKGKALISTPNRKLSLTRNPWHVREYLAHELQEKCNAIFSHVDTMGVSGNEKVMAYYEMNRKSVEKLTRWDFLNLQYKLPASIIKIPYEVLNRLNRNKLQDSDNSLVSSIAYQDYDIVHDPADSLDLFYLVTK